MRRIGRAALLVGVVAVACSTAGLAWANADEGQRQRLDMLFITHDGVEEHTHAVASGPIRGQASYTEQERERTPEGVRGSFTLEFNRGTVSASFVERDIQVNLDERRCLAEASGRGTIEITGGTGAYAGATGTLSFTRQGRLVGARGERGECLGRSAPPKVAVMRVDAVGTASLRG